MIRRIRKALTRDGSVSCTVGNWLTARGWRRTYFAVRRIEGVYNRVRYWLERWTTPQAPQCRRFLDLFNANKIKVGYPGHFYVLPFFMKYDEK